jgi:hypothetical protein
MKDVILTTDPKWKIPNFVFRQCKGFNSSILVAYDKVTERVYIRVGAPYYGKLFEMDTDMIPYFIKALYQLWRDNK